MTETEWTEEFSERFKEMIDESWMTRSELATESGVSEAAISYYANGTRTPGVKAIINLAYALDCDVRDLIDFGEPID